MLVTSVTVSFQETHSLPEYCNVKPMLSLTAQIGEEDAADVIAALTQQVQAYVHGEIDAALERVGKAAVYDTESERVDLYLWHVLGGVVLLLPHDANTQLHRRRSKEFPGRVETLTVPVFDGFAESQNQRHERAWNLAQRYAQREGVLVLDWSHLFWIDAEDYPETVIDRMWDELIARDAWVSAELRLVKRDHAGYVTRVVKHALVFPVYVMRYLDASRDKLANVGYFARDGEAIIHAEEPTTVDVVKTMDALLGLIAAYEAQFPEDCAETTEEDVEWIGDEHEDDEYDIDDEDEAEV
jgi:hypothetical protein